MKKLLLLICLLALAACARPPLEPLPLTPGLDAELLRTALTQGEKYQSLKSMARMKIDNGAQSMNLSHVLILQKPDKLRIDVLSPFGSTYLQASSDGERLNLSIPGKRRFYTGPPSPENLQLLTRMPIRVEQAVDLLLYTVPILAGEVAALSARGRDGYVLTLERDGIRQVIWFDVEKRLTASFWYRDDVLQGEVGYAGFEEGGHFPTEVTIVQPLANATLRAVFSSPKPNAVIDPQLFSIQPPAGVEPEPFPPLNPPPALEDDEEG